MGFEGEPSRYDDIESNKIEEPLLDKADNARERGYQKQSDSIVSVPSSQEGTSIFGYNLGVRPFQDITFGLIFILLVLVSVAFGIYGVVNSNPEYMWIDTAQYEPGQGCSIPAHLHLGTPTFNGTRAWALHLYTPFFLEDAFVKEGDGATSYKPIWITLGVTLVLSGPLALGVLYLLRKHTKELVYATLPAFILGPIVANLTWFIWCQRSAECQRQIDSNGQFVAFGCIFIGIAIMIYVIYSNWSRVQMTIRIVKTASEALHQNLALVFILPSLGLALILFWIPFVTFMLYAYTNGNLITNPEISENPDAHCAAGTDTPCCVWQPNAWVPYYMYLAGFAVLWSSTIMAQIQVFTISGTVAQWYFAQADSSTVGTTRRSLRNAFGPSFGTACLGGLIVAFVRVIRGALNQEDNQQGQQGALGVFVRACLQWILDAVEFFTRFTSNFAAITGGSFCTSASMTYDLLTRNFLSTVLVEVISDRLLSMVLLAFSFFYALLVYGILHITTSAVRELKLTATGLSWFILFVIFVTFIRLLSNVIDTVYICYAMDKDQGVTSNHEVHNVFVLLPSSPGENPSLAHRT